MLSLKWSTRRQTDLNIEENTADPWATAVPVLPSATLIINELPISCLSLTGYLQFEYCLDKYFYLFIYIFFFFLFAAFSLFLFLAVAAVNYKLLSGLLGLAVAHVPSPPPPTSVSPGNSSSAAQVSRCCRFCFVPLLPLLPRAVHFGALYLSSSACLLPRLLPNSVSFII